MQRRLAAIIAADVVGFSRMVRADEEGTLRDLRDARARVVDPAIARYDGRIVKLMGDGVLVEFGSAVDAVMTALEVQRAMPDWNAHRPKERHIIYRVGVNLGDVVIDGDDIQGDGVNLAARIEATSAPGTVCISNAVHEQIRDRLDEDFSDLGPLQMKNFDRPVHVWQWSNGAATLKVFPEDSIPELPDKPSIAVLPFDNMSGDPEQAFFADGIAEDIITALSRKRDLFVIARHSSFTFRGPSVDMRRVGRELGVQFVLEGSVRRAGERVRITAQLIEAHAGAHVWAEKYDRPLADVFDVQDEITMNVAGAVGSEIWASVARAAAKRSVDDLQSWERMMKAYWYFYQKNAQDTETGRAILLKEIEAHPDRAELYAARVFGCTAEITWGYGNRSPHEVFQDGVSAGRKAIALDANSDAAHANLSFLLWVGGDHEGAIHEANEAIRLNPNSATGYCFLSAALGFSGIEHHAMARDYALKSIRLGPRDLILTWNYLFLCVFSFVSGDYPDAIAMSRTALRADPTTAPLRGSLRPLWRWTVRTRQRAPHGSGRKRYSQ